MDDVVGKIAVVTGGGTGMGRELVRQLSARGCHVSMCDVNEANMAETADLAVKEAPEGTRITSFVADVSDAAQMDAFAAHVLAEHDTDHVNLVFNNAGIGGAGSFINDPQANWERTFGICWGGVYNGCRSFLPLLVAGDGGHVVNTSSVNGLWASIGPNTPHTAYSAAKFAVRGFTEALITDLKLNAPHVQAHVVMPGHIGTDIVLNSTAMLSGGAVDFDQIRAGAARQGMDLTGFSDEDLQAFVAARGETFRDEAPMTAEEAATIMIDGVLSGTWRILVGEDAHVLDELVRARPAEAYSEEFFADMAKAGGLQLGV